ncbi:MAG TPA: SDR family NAD(P)-dependent oxidoreductase [Candidatus Binatia bacterium]|jgi:NAD(P)-dependent dehydrogenase (short-subunit alcohol dehydrogenase family)
MRDLREKVVLVTGGGRGIGRAIALAFAAEGSHVVIAGRTQATLDAAAKEAGCRWAKVLPLSCDVGQKSEVEELKREIARRLGDVQILINNAGIAPAAAFLEMEDSLWDEVLRVNLTGTYYCCKAFLPEMIAAKWGRVVNIASTVAKTSYPNISAYASSKHAVLGLTRSLAVETARHGVTVNAVCPGYVDTGLTKKNALALAQKTRKPVEEAWAMIQSASPQKRLIDVDEVASLAVMLASEAARGINGQAINVDGGAVMT